ncbi:MAG TPA: hypothetical protein VI138_05365 [Candidatus Dormibacteraeota bacterium]
MGRFPGGKLAAGVCLSVAALALGLVTLPAVGATSTGDAYFPVAPTRLLDTRVDGGTLGPNSSINLGLAGVGAVPGDATAVAVNVTATDTTAPSYLTVYPAGESIPTSSNLNWNPGQTVANLVIVPLGGGGALSFYNSGGSVDLVVDLQGYFAASAGAGPGEYLPLSPARITDTRAGSGYPNQGQTLGAAAALTVQVAGQGGVPSVGVAAAVLNVTVTDANADSYLSVYPADETNPGTSSVNWSAGSTVANRVVVPLSPSGQVTAFNDLGQADVIIDVSGYFTTGPSPSAAASLYYPIAPTRVLDTRLDGSQPSAGSDLGEQFAAVDGIGAQASAVVANLTSTDASTASYYRLAPEATGSGTSDLNWSAGATVANLDIAPLSSTGDAYLYNSQGQADAVIDVFGYFVPLDPVNAPAVAPCSSVAISATAPGISGGPVDATAEAVCGSGASIEYTYWYRAPGSALWTLAGPPGSASSLQYSTAGWVSGTYRLMAWASSQAGVYQGALGGSSVLMSLNPATNLPDTFMSTCYSDGFLSAACTDAEVSAINGARSDEGLPALTWSSTLAALTPAQQIFIVANEERISRGLPPIAGMTAAAIQSATEGAENNTDPSGSNVPGAIGYASNWAEDFGPLGAMFDWMYNDGPGSFNLDCPSAGRPGCWAHRDDILLSTASGSTAAPAGYTWVGGTACAPEQGVSYLDACALEWVLVPSSSVTYQFTWDDAVALGA